MFVANNQCATTYSKSFMWLWLHDWDIVEVFNLVDFA